MKNQKYQIELIVSIAYFNPLAAQRVDEKRVMRFIEMETMKFDAADLARVLDDIEDDVLQNEHEEGRADAFSTCCMVVGMYKDGEFIEDLDALLFNQGIAYRTDK